MPLPYEGRDAAAEQGFPGPGSYAAAVLRAHEDAGLATHIRDSTGAVRWAACNSVWPEALLLAGTKSQQMLSGMQATAVCLQSEVMKSPLLAVMLWPSCGATCWYVHDFQSMLQGQHFPFSDALERCGEGLSWQHWFCSSFMA